jgi:hypothetical protein
MFEVRSLRFEVKRPQNIERQTSNIKQSSWQNPGLKINRDESES